jgi:hypothetical protein
MGGTALGSVSDFLAFDSLKAGLSADSASSFLPQFEIDFVTDFVRPLYKHVNLFIKEDKRMHTEDGESRHRGYAACI